MGNPYLEKIAEVSKKEAAAYGTAAGAHVTGRAVTKVGLNKLRKLDYKLSELDSRVSSAAHNSYVKAVFSKDPKVRDFHTRRAATLNRRIIGPTFKVNAAKRDITKKVNSVRKISNVVAGAGLATGLYQSLKKDD